MAPPDLLFVDLLSDTTFASGERTPGAVDVEVAHSREGLPIVPGKTIHGLLREAWLSMGSHFEELTGPVLRILGPAADLEETSILRIGTASLSPNTIAWARHATLRKRYPLHPMEILESLTEVRHQTARSRGTGAPEHATLRASRVVIRGARFGAPLEFLEPPAEDDLRALALACLATRQAGLGRNRGRGLVLLTLGGREDWEKKPGDLRAATTKLAGFERGEAA